MSVEFRGVGIATKKSELQSLKTKAPQTQRRSLKENKRAAGHALCASAQLLGMKIVQDDSSSSKSESPIY